MAETMHRRDEALPEIDFRRLFEAAPGLYLVLLPDAPRYTIVAVSDAYAKATMTSRGAIIGRGLFEIFPDNPDDRGADATSNLGSSLERVIRTGAPDVMPVQKYDIRRPDEAGGGFEERWWSPVNSPVFGEDGALEHIIHRVEDVTEFVRIEQAGAEQRQRAEHLRSRAESLEAAVFQRAQELQQVNRRLQEANAETTRLYQRSKELEELKTQFFANVSHELRTPLALIIGPTQRLLGMSELPTPVRSDLEVIARNARTLLRHVDDLLDVSKLEAGQMTPRYVDADVARLARFVAGHFEVAAREKRLTFDVDVADGVRGEVDPDMVRRILLNLLSNAMKFTPEGGRVRVSVRADDQARLIIEVADSGPGIAPPLREAVFERFRQLAGGATRRFGGTGLGLAIARDFAALHQGTLRVTEAPEGGALFVAELPQRAPTGAAVSPASELGGDEETSGEVEALRGGRARDTGQTGDVAGPLVLVVEDNPDMNRFLCECLAADHRVATAFDGREGLEKALELRPELIVTDVMMPELSGDELVREIRARRELDRIPIVVLTAKADIDLRVQILRDGAQDFVAKPFTVEELRVRVDNLLASKRAGERILELGEQLERVSSAQSAVAEAVAGLPEASLEAVLRTIALQAQLLVGAELVAVGIGVDPEKPFSPWVVAGVSAEQAALIGRHPRPVGTLGAVARRNEVICASDVTAHPDFRGVPPHHPPLTSLLGVPILFRGRSVGNLYLANKRGQSKFTPQDQRLVEMLASRAGVAVETAYLYRREGMQRAWLHAVFDQMPEGVALRDAAGRILVRNRALAALTRHDLDAIDPYGEPVVLDLRRPSGERLTADEHPDVRALLDAEQVVGRELAVALPDGRLLPVLVSAAPVFGSADQLTGSTMIVQDIRVLKELERMREEWVSIIAHDLRQPVDVISVATQLLPLLGPEAARERESAVARIRAAARRLNRMIEDLLDASRIEARRLTIQPRSVGVAALAREVLERLPEVAARARIDVAPDATNVNAWADPDRVEQVLTNLLTNAVKYGDPDGPIDVAVTAREREIEVAVTNRGRAIPAEVLPRLFERYERGREARTARPGLGLGLYICKGLLEAHGGRIWVDSAEGRTRFHFTLPRDPAAELAPTSR